jgi:hypothetical protein
MRSAVLANARSRVCFQLGHEDASVIVRGDRLITPDDFRELGAYETYVSLIAEQQRTAWASGRTRPPVPSLGTESLVSAQSRERWGVPKTDTEAAIRRLIDQPTIGSATANTALGRRRRPRGGNGEAP